MTRQGGIPFVGLAVLKEEEFVIVVCGQAITGVADVHCLQALGSRCQCRWLTGKSQFPALPQAVAHRGATIVVVATACHDVPAARVVALATTATVVGVVEVGQSQHVTKLMANGANGIGDGVAVALPSINLARRGVASHVLAVELNIIGVAVVIEVAHVWPQVALVVATVARRVSGNHEEHHVDRAVIVGVIICEIHLAINGSERVTKNLTSFGVALVA